MASLPRQKAPKGRHNSSTSIEPLADPRFSRLETDPRFRLPSRKQTRVTLDKRFESILKDAEFSQKASVDRYGRKVDKDAGRRELQRLYRLETEDRIAAAENESGEEDEVVLKELDRVEKKYDPAREGGFSESSSEEEFSDDDDEEIEDERLEQQGEDVDAEADPDVPMGEITNRLACVNMDWDNIRAVDLMAVASSFVPPEGRISKVVVYPSEFGKERLEREEREGPAKELFAHGRKKRKKETGSDSEGEDNLIKKQLQQEDKGEELDKTALRRYQLDCLRYYYAVIECSSKEVAKALYDDMDGREYLSSANFFDLRFIPDEVEFNDDQPRDTCDQLPEGYRPMDFVTEALRHSNVKLTWDADDGKRKEIQKRAFSQKEIDENDLQAYIGSGSSSDDGEEEQHEILDDDANDDAVSIVSKATTRAERRDALRAALGLPPEPVKTSKKIKKNDGPVGDMQITFTPALAASEPKKGAVFKYRPEGEETTREKYVRKEKERKQRRKERLLAVREARDPDAVVQKAQNELDDGDGSIFLGGSDEDEDPFNDPFFTDPVAAEKDAKRSNKEVKARKRAEREVEEKAAEAEKAELQLLMDDDSNLRHFDMKEIQKAEKLARKKSRKNKNKGVRGEYDSSGGPDGFKMDVQDPRFARIFEDHEFAIDPTNPRFRDTKAMNQLLEEGRKKRARLQEPMAEEARPVKKSRATDGTTEKKDDLKTLVEKIKRRPVR